MAGTMVRRLELQIRADDGDTAVKLDRIQQRAEELKEAHPDLAVRIDTAAASEKLKVLRQELRDTTTAAEEQPIDIRVASAEAKAKLDAIKANAEELRKLNPTLIPRIDDAEASAKLQVLRGELRETEKEGSGKAWEAAKYALLGVGAALAYGIYKAAGFQQVLERVHTQAGVAQGRLASLGAGVLKLAGQVGFSPDSLAEALYHVASNMAGLHATAPQMLNAVKVAAEGAAVGGSDLVDTTNALGAVIAAKMPGVNSYTQAMGALNKTVGEGDMTMQDLSEAMGTGFLANVKLYGTTLNDASAILATFGDNLIRGSHAGTQLRMSVQAIAVQAKTAGPYLANIGLKLGDLGREQALHGTVAAVQMFVDHLKASKIPMDEWGNYVTQIFGKKAGGGIGILVDQLDSRLLPKFRDITKAANGFGDAWKAQQDTAQQKLKDLEYGSEALAISLGEKLLPIATKVMGWLSDFVNGLENGSAGATAVAAVIGTVLAGIALKKLEDGLSGAIEGVEGLWKGFAKTTQVIGGMIGKLFGLTVAQNAQKAATAEGTVAQEGLNTAMSLNPIGVIVLAIAALGVAFYELWEHVKAFRDFWKDAWHDIAHYFDDARHAIAASFDWVIRTVEHAWREVSHWFSQMWHDVTRFASDIWHDVTSWFSRTWHDVTGFVSDLRHDVAAIWDQVWADTVSRMVTGGGRILNWFQALPGRIWNFLKGLPGQMLHLGEAIVEGIWNGISSAAGWLWNHISGWASNILGDIGRAFGISSPSKYTRIHGQMIAEGLALGIQDGQGRAALAAAQMARRVLAATSPGGAGGYGAYGAYGGRLQIEWVGGGGADQQFLTWLKKNIRIRGADPAIVGR